MLTIQMAAMSVSGRGRPVNQDCLGFDEAVGYFALADGMGGHEAGEVASNMAVNLGLELLCSLGERLGCEEISSELNRFFAHINTAVFEAASCRAGDGRMGATLILGYLEGGFLHFMHVGDSRMYLYRDSELALLTEDHSLRQEMINAAPLKAEQIIQQIPPNIITRAIGAKVEISSCYGKQQLLQEDLILVCSDGVHAAMSNSLLEDAMSGIESLQSGVRKLADIARCLDGRDDLSLILLRVS